MNHTPQLNRLRCLSVYCCLVTVTMLATTAGIGVANAQGGSPAQAITCEIHGMVRDAKGKPVRDAEVAAESSSDTVRLNASPSGEYSGTLRACGGQVRITVTGKGFEPASAEANVPDATPACKADFTLYKKGQRDTGPAKLECEEPTPYATMLSFQAALGESPFMNLAPNQLTSFGSHIEKGKTIESNFIVGSYAFKTIPPARQPIRLRVAGAPEGASWLLSNPNAATLTKIDDKEVRVEFAKDGEAELRIQSAGEILLRVRLIAATLEKDNMWAITAERVTDKGERIDMDGHVAHQK